MAGFPSEFAIHTARPFNRVVTPYIAARDTDVQNDLRFRRHTQLQNDLPITIQPCNVIHRYNAIGRSSEPERSSRPSL
jgi:hypothetical protein